MSEMSFTPETDWRCDTCGEMLEPRTVPVTYLGHEFAVKLLVCPECNMVLIPEELALGKMLEVEQLLEDK